MEILCKTGDTLLDEMARVIIHQAAEGYPLPEGGRIILAESAADAGISAGERDFLILLYRSHTTLQKSTPNCRMLKRPYSIKELESTVRQLLSAVSIGEKAENTDAVGTASTAAAVSTVPAATVAFDGRTVSIGDIAVSLTKREAAVFGILYENRGTSVSREKLTEEVWGRSTETNLCDVYVCHLRAKLEPIFGKGFLTNLRNEGYMMV